VVSILFFWLATSLAMETWPVEHRVFVYDAFVKSGESEESEESR